jgi:hypothetical protein
VAETCQCLYHLEMRSLLLILLTLTVAGGFTNCGGFQSAVLTADLAHTISQNGETTAPPLELEKKGGVNPYSCLAGSEPAPTDIRRLSRREYLLTLELLVKGSIELSALLDKTNLLPADTTDEVFDSTDTSLSNDHVEAYLNIAREVSSLLTAKTEWLRNEVNCTATSGMTDACWTTFFNGFATRVYRRPLTSSEQSDLKSLYSSQSSGGFTNGLQAVVMAILQSPNFLYKVETAGTPINGREDLVKLSDYELAARLAFLATGRGPDSTLIEDARAGRLASTASFKTVAARVFNSSSARQHINEFYLQWLGAKRLPSSTHSDWFLAGVARSSIAPEALQELQDLTTDLTFNKPGSYRNLLVDETSYVKGSALGKIYGGDVSLPFQQRPGVMSRTAFLLSATNSTSLVHRGLLVRRNLLCEKIKFPTITDATKELFAPPKPNPSSSLRQQIELRTSPAQCQGCHAQLNPMGFVLENYDSLGRYQSEETVYDSTGNVLARHPIDARVVPNIEEANEAPVTGLAEMAEALAASSKGPACAAQQWFTFAQGREPASVDSCVLKEMFSALQDQKLVSPSGDSSGTILNMLKSPAFQPEFRLRKVSPQ